MEYDRQAPLGSASHDDRMGPATLPEEDDLNLTKLSSFPEVVGPAGLGLLEVRAKGAHHIP